jgi:Tat protein translocase TatB subunit
MLNVGGPEVVVIALVALVVLGPERLPDAVRQVGRVLGEIKKVTTGFEREMRSALSDLDDDTIEAEARRRGMAVTDAESAADPSASDTSSDDPSAGEPASTEHVPVTEPEALEDDAPTPEPSKLEVAHEPSGTEPAPDELPVTGPTQ